MSINNAKLTNFWKVKTYDEVSRNAVDLFSEPIPCMHGNLMRESSLASEEFGLITDDINNRYPPTEIVTYDPWASDPASKDYETYTGKSPAERCEPSELADREDAFRCFLEIGVIDPCFINNDDELKPLLCVTPESTIKVDSVWAEPREYQVPPIGEGSVFKVILPDGSPCYASSGAGPREIEGYPYWFGNCAGRYEGVWRARESNDDPLFRIYDPTENGTYFVAVSVGDSEAPAELIPVKTAYR